MHGRHGYDIEDVLSAWVICVFDYVCKGKPKHCFSSTIGVSPVNCYSRGELCDCARVVWTICRFRWMSRPNGNDSERT